MQDDVGRAEREAKRGRVGRGEVRGLIQNERAEEHLVGDRLTVFIVVMTSQVLPMLKPNYYML